MYGGAVEIAERWAHTAGENRGRAEKAKAELFKAWERISGLCSELDRQNAVNVEREEVISRLNNSCVEQSRTIEELRAHCERMREATECPCCDHSGDDTDCPKHGGKNALRRVFEKLLVVLARTPAGSLDDIKAEARTRALEDAARFAENGYAGPEGMSLYERAVGDRIARGIRALASSEPKGKEAGK